MVKAAGFFLFWNADDAPVLRGRDLADNRGLKTEQYRKIPVVRAVGILFYTSGRQPYLPCSKFS